MVKIEILRYLSDDNYPLTAFFPSEMTVRGQFYEYCFRTIRNISTKNEIMRYNNPNYVTAEKSQAGAGSIPVQ